MERQHKKPVAEPLRRKDGTPLQVGDILWARIQYAGCSHHHSLVKVERITPTGALRVRTLATTSKMLEFGVWGSRTQIWPDDTGSPGALMRLRPDGSCGSQRHNYRLYRHYTPDTELVNVDDNGD